MLIENDKRSIRVLDAYVRVSGAFLLSIVLCSLATYLVLKDFENASGVLTRGGALEDILFVFALVSSRIMVSREVGTAAFDRLYLKQITHLQIRVAVKCSELHSGDG